MAGSPPQLCSTLAKVGSSGGLVLEFRLFVRFGAGMVPFGGFKVSAGSRGIFFLVFLVPLGVLVVIFGVSGVHRGESLGASSSPEFGGSRAANLVDLVLVATHVGLGAAPLFHVLDGVFPVLATLLLGQCVEFSPADSVFSGRLFDARPTDFVEVSTLVKDFDVKVAVAAAAATTPGPLNGDASKPH